MTDTDTGAHADNPLLKKALKKNAKAKAKAEAQGDTGSIRAKARRRRPAHLSEFGHHAHIA